LYDRSFEVHGDRRATERVRIVTTVLSAAGRSAGELAVYHDGFRSVRSLAGQIRDRNGRVVRRLGRREIEDRSMISSSDIYPDARIMTAEIYFDQYPYTVEFEYELRYNSSFHRPTWTPQKSPAPVMFSRFTFAAPVTEEVRYHSRSLDVTPTIQENRRQRVHEWVATMLPVRREQPFGPTWSEQAGAILIAPSDFTISGTRGSMSTWSELGSWYGQLARGRQVLPAAAKEEVRRLLENVEADREKARILYNFLQERSRYVSIQLGIGGWQPFDAQYVHERRYGDCKALTNYLMAIFHEAGINAYPALIGNGRNRPDIPEDFPSNQFNHVILYVPLEDGDVWLEATSRTYPFGHIGAGNENRFALVVKEEGSRLIRTPSSTSADNRQDRRAEVVIDNGGDAHVAVETRYSGNQQDHVRGALDGASPRDRERWLNRSTRIPSFRILGADYSSVDAREVELVLPIELSVPRLASTTGSRMFLTPNLMERRTQIPPEVPDRTQPVRLGYAYLDTDEIRYVLPKGVAVEAFPEEVILETSFGRFESSTRLDDEGRLIFRRLLEMRETTIPAEEYAAFRSFFSDIVRADRGQVVLVRR
jgi:hypothetical protein